MFSFDTEPFVPRWHSIFVVFVIFGYFIAVYRHHKRCQVCNTQLETLNRNWLMNNLRPFISLIAHSKAIVRSSCVRLQPFMSFANLTPSCASKEMKQERREIASKHCSWEVKSLMKEKAVIFLAHSIHIEEEERSADSDHLKPTWCLPGQWAASNWGGYERTAGGKTTHFLSKPITFQ